MPYRPQYAYPDPPDGQAEEDFVYYFDQTNTPALAGLTNNNPVLRIPLQLQADAPFILRGIQVSGNLGNVLVRLWDANDNPLSQTLQEVDRMYAGSENGIPPIGKLPVPFEPEMPCPAGGFLQIDVVLINP
jgi:hypothetical protein